MVAVLLGCLARWVLGGAIGPTALPFITFFPAVAWAAWYGGLGPAILAVLLAAILAAWFFFEPLFAFRLGDPVAFLAFPAAAAIIVAAIEVMHRTRRKLAKAYHVLSTTLTSIGDGVIVTDAEGRITFLNPRAEQLTRWRRDDAFGRPLVEVFRIVNETTRRDVEDPVARVLRDGNIVGIANHTLLIAKGGSEIPIDDSAAPVRQVGGATLGAVLVFRDVREQRLADAARARLAAIVESSGDAILSKSLDGTILTWNAAAERLFGYTSEEMVGRSILTLIPSELREEENLIVERLRSGRSAELIETKRLTKDGKRIPVSVRVSPLMDVDGTVIGASKTVRDLSDLVAARDELSREKDLLATTLASIGDAVIVTDAAGCVTFLNPVAERLTGWSQRDALGQPLQDVFRIVNEWTRREAENPALRAMREGTIIGLANHTVLLARSGDELPIDDSAAPIRGADGKLAGSVLVFRDITARRQTERELREADQRKNEFLATLAHELRNPLAPIKNSVMLLQLKGPPDKELAAARDVIERQVGQLSRLLDDLLDINRLVHQKLELRKETVTLRSIIDSALETAGPGILNGRHRVSVEVPDDVILDADAVRLAQVFANLLNNAAKYTDSGGQFWVRATEQGSEVIVRVRDTGIGIAPESLPRLFEMFSQVPVALKSAQGGFGIGLSLARGIVELHGGSISARSDGLGKGSEFTVRLPVLVRAVPHAPVSKSGRLASESGMSRKILIADDVRDNADTLSMMLQALGHDVRVVYNGAEAVAEAERLRPQVALLDIGMPGMDGYEVCQRIREQPWGKLMYLVAQTGWGQEEDRRRAEQAGFDWHMLKPIDCADLVAVLDRLPERSSGL